MSFSGYQITGNTNVIMGGGEGMNMSRINFTNIFEQPIRHFFGALNYAQSRQQIIATT